MLQLVIGDIPEKSADLEDDPFAFDAVMQAYVCNVLCGSIIALCMLHSHSNTAPTNPEKHAMRRGVYSTAIFYVGLSCKTCVTLMVGIGIKIALYDPTLDPTTDSAVNHRLQLGFSLFMTFGHQLVLKPLHQGAGSYFKPIMRNPISLVSLILRCAIYLAMLLVSLVVVPAWQYLIIQAALSLSATACHQIENWVCAMEIERAGAHAHDWTREPSMKFVDPH